MSYSSFLIANFATGYDRELQPWLLPNDAFTDLLDGYVYRGVVTKRDGYNGYAIGEDSTYTESRIVHHLASVAPATGVINGVNKVFTFTFTTPVSRGSITITGSAPVQVVTDDGLGGFIGAIDPLGVNTINYTTGAATVTFLVAPAGASTVLAGYDYFPGLPVMGIMSYWPINNVRQMIVADTKYINRYNPATDRLEDITNTALNGTNSDFLGWVNYAAANSDPRLLFSNLVNGDVIQQWDGSNVTNYAALYNGAPFVINARQMFNFSGRLVLVQTRETGVLFPKRIRISGTGINCDEFGTNFSGAGFIDIDDNTQLFGAIQNRNDLLVFTEGSTWVLKYTGNDINPFQLQRLDNSRGCAAAFSVISYLNRSMAASPRGLIMCDGYQVERMDDNIPQFSFNQINDEFFNRCFSAFLDEDRDVYMMYPSVNVERPALVAANASDEILVSNFEEDNFCIYQIPLSCMGNFQETITKQWQDLSAANGYTNWNILASNFNNWNAFPFTIGSPISIGGGHKGEIWSMNTNQATDNPQPIRAISIINAGNPQTIRVTTDWNNYNVGDYIYFSGVEGMTQINNKQGEIISPIVTAYNTFDVKFNEYLGTLTAWTSGGEATKSFEFSAISKKLNPWIESDKKVRCGWMYFYVSTSETLLKEYKVVNGVETQVDVPCILTVEVITSNNDAPDFTKPQFEYEINCTNINDEIGGKKWVKIWINQVGQFLQFRISNRQAGAIIQVHAMMCGFQPVGRLV